MHFVEPVGFWLYFSVACHVVAFYFLLIPGMVMESRISNANKADKKNYAQSLKKRMKFYLILGFGCFIIGLLPRLAFF
jgi:hypothetical protein